MLDLHRYMVACVRNLNCSGTASVSEIVKVLPLVAAVAVDLLVKLVVYPPQGRSDLHPQRK